MLGFEKWGHMNYLAVFHNDIVIHITPQCSQPL